MTEASVDNYRHYGSADAAWAEAEFSHRNVPFYGDSLASHMQSGRSLEAFASLPISTKSDYRKNFPGRILVNSTSVNGPYVSRQQSSGTSGDRLISVIHSFKMAHRMATCLSVNPDLAFLQSERKIRMVRYGAPNCSDVECSNPNATKADRMLPDGTLVLPVYHDLLTTPRPMLEKAFEELHSHEANIWYVDPMHLSFLINRAKEWGWTWNLDLNRKVAVLLSFTLATRALRRQLRTLCGDRFPVANVMAMSEFGFVGLDCPHGNLHLNDQDYFLELLPVPTGSAEKRLSELLVTSIGDRLCPHVRYQTNDVYRVLESCACGHSMPAVTFEGRKKDLVQLESGKVLTPQDLDRAVGAPAWIDVYQLAFQRPNTFVFRFRGDESAYQEREKQELTARLEELFEVKGVRVEPSPYFPFDRGGKFPLIRVD